MRLRSLLCCFGVVCAGLAASGSARAAPPSLDDLSSAMVRLRESWNALDAGLAYSADSVILISAFGRPVSPPDESKWVVEPGEPMRDERPFSFASVGGSYEYMSDQGTGVRADAEKLYTIAEDGTIAVRAGRSPKTEEDISNLPFFDPNSAWNHWAGFPWPSWGLKKGHTLRQRLVTASEDEAVVEVVQSYVQEGPGGPSLRQTRHVTFRRVDRLGWLPVRIEWRWLNDREPTRVETVEWSSVDVDGRPVPLPHAYTHQGYFINHATDGSRVLTTTRSYVMRENTIRTRAQAPDAPQWATVTGPRTLVGVFDQMTAAHARAATPTFRPYALALIALCVGAVVLWQWHRRDATPPRAA